MDFTIRSHSHFLRSYTKERLLGSGGFGRVFAGRRLLDDRPVAIKEIVAEKVPEWTNWKGRKVPLEMVLALSVGDVDGVIECLEVCDARESGAFVLVLDRPVNSIDLFDYISQRKVLEEERAKDFFEQAVRVVVAVHDRGVFHNDIKDENFVIDLDSMRLKLIDFGAALRLEDRLYTHRDFNGTRIWSPPEFIASKTFEAESCTVWTLGCLLFDMVCGDIPFRTEDDIVKGTFKYFRVMPRPIVRDLIERCLRLDAKKRMRLGDILQHPWLREKTTSPREKTTPRKRETTPTTPARETTPQKREAAESSSSRSASTPKRVSPRDRRSGAKPERRSLRQANRVAKTKNKENSGAKKI